MAGGAGQQGNLLQALGQQGQHYGMAPVPPGNYGNFGGTAQAPQLYGGPWNQLTQLMAGPSFNSPPQSAMPSPQSGFSQRQQGMQQAPVGFGSGANLPYFANPYGTNRGMMR